MMVQHDRGVPVGRERVVAGTRLRVDEGIRGAGLRLEVLQPLERSAELFHLGPVFRAAYDPAECQRHRQRAGTLDDETEARRRRDAVGVRIVMSDDQNTVGSLQRPPHVGQLIDDLGRRATRVLGARLRLGRCVRRLGRRLVHGAHQSEQSP
jgi:hypothetical protein